MNSNLKFVKKLNDPNIMNLQQLYFSFIFGDEIPGLYNENGIYNTGDVILHLNESDVYEILGAKEDGITGPFNMDYWQKISFTDIIKDADMLNGGGKNVIIISDVQPDVKSNKIWLKPIKECTINLSAIEK